MNRRAFFWSAGALSVAGRFARVLEGRAEAATPPRRLIFFATPNGTLMDRFWPGPGCAYPEILKPLEPLKAKLIVMRGINMMTAYKTPIPADHLPDFPNALTGLQRPATGGNNGIAGITVDQHIANAIGSKTKFASLHLGVKGDVNRFPLFARGPNQPISFENSPQRLFTRLFGELAAGAGAGTAEADKAIARARADRLSVLDFVKGELADIRCRVGSDERYKMDAHLESIREVEKNVSFQAPAEGCRVPPAPDAATPDFPTTSKMQIDLLAAALSCDLTRVVGFQYSYGGSNVSHDWVDASGDHHAMSHSLCCAKPDVKQDLLGKIARIETWYASQFAYLLGKLNAIPEGTGTLLDATAALWMHEQSDGNTHSRKDMPYVLAGSCRGVFKTGRCVQYNGSPHNGLLISLANAMEVPTTAFGDPEFSTGPLADL